jgi:hypothetical protein
LPQAQRFFIPNEVKNLSPPWATNQERFLASLGMTAGALFP